MIALPSRRHNRFPIGCRRRPPADGPRACGSSQCSGWAPPRCRGPGGSRQGGGRGTGKDPQEPGPARRPVDGRARRVARRCPGPSRGAGHGATGGSIPLSAQACSAAHRAACPMARCRPGPIALTGGAAFLSLRPGRVCEWSPLVRAPRRRPALSSFDKGRRDRVGCLPRPVTQASGRPSAGYSVSRSTTDAVSSPASSTSASFTSRWVTRRMVHGPSSRHQTPAAARRRTRPAAGVPERRVST